MMKKLLVIGMSWALLAQTGCAHRAALVDDAGRPIREEEVQARKKNTNFLLFTLGGGALSFGASFFLGSLLDRGMNSSSQSALWITTGAGTLAGIVYFAHQGRVRDYNLALETIKEERVKNLNAQLDKERERRKHIEREKQRLLEERKRQEEERKKLLEALKKKKKD